MPPHIRTDAPITLRANRSLTTYERDLTPITSFEDEPTAHEWRTATALTVAALGCVLVALGLGVGGQHFPAFLLAIAGVVLSGWVLNHNRYVKRPAIVLNAALLVAILNWGLVVGFGVASYITAIGKDVGELLGR